MARIEDGHAVVGLTDQRVGVTEDEASHPFRRAYRGRRRRLGNVLGLGLGLWIARILVAVNGGTLSADYR